MSSLFRHAERGQTYALLREHDNFGIKELDLAAPPSRFWADGLAAPAVMDQGVDQRRIDRLSSPAELLANLPPADNWNAQARRSLARLQAWFLISEDPQRRLDAQPVATLAHQASLVRHVLTNPNLRRVLIADEVGLGKTVEAGLIIRELLASRPGLRVLYLAPARLVRNVRKEFDRLGLAFRQWVAGDDCDASLRDSQIIASIHRAALESNIEKLLSTPPWDVIVVDECHHLSDWEKGGGKPVRKYVLVRDLVARQPTDARVILMSGTPHQGHPHRFENLLALLEQPSGSQPASVIYRTKDDVRDWGGDPLFPGRQVNPPLVVNLGEDHRQWLTNIYDFYVPARNLTADTGANRRRAAGWRCAQALQWATSSIQAGLGYLIRQAIRAKWDLSAPSLASAIAAVRPYRLGPDDEPAHQLFTRIQREVHRQIAANDVEDIEDLEEDTERWEPDPLALAGLLEEGVRLLEESGDDKWQILYEQLLATPDNEKVVLFAQPIETVTALSRFLEKTTGNAPALIIGDQSETERDQMVEAFWRSDGPRFLVSSRAGGEGINLQVASRLVHVDVPWNPMELEQRVGRVHRFGSRQTIVVDTLVAQDSREVDAYRIAHRKLSEIASTLVPGDRFESLYGRVMSLVPPTELQEILTQHAAAPLTGPEQQQIADLVAEGFRNWQSFHNKFSDQQKQIRDLYAGQAQWSDVARFALDHLGAEPAQGFSALRFRWESGEAREDRAEASVLALNGHGIFACGDYAGMPITGPGGDHAEILGLNVPILTRALRNAGFPDAPSGAAHLRWPKQAGLPAGVSRLPFAVWIAVRQSLSLGQSAPTQTISAMRVMLLDGAGKEFQVDGETAAKLVRTLLDATVRREPEAAAELIAALVQREKDWILTLRRPSDTEREERTFHAVFPIFSAILS